MILIYSSDCFNRILSPYFLRGCEKKLAPFVKYEKLAFKLQQLTRGENNYRDIRAYFPHIADIIFFKVRYLKRKSVGKGNT